MAEKKFSVTLKEIIDEFHLETIHLPMDASKLLVIETEINRPGLQLSGFYEYFNNERIQIVGKAEFAYLATMEESVRKEHLEMLFAQHVPCIIITRELPYFPEMLDLLIEVYGEGMLILGESGVGKSETAVELIKRGHRLVADDAVEIRKVSNISLVGSSPENIRHFLELRGIGIVNARRLFGMGAVKVTEKIDMIVELEPWDSEKVYDRMGVDSEYTSILGVKVPCSTIPVKPGRNLAVILEVAAMNNRQKKMGYNAAQELLDNLGLETEHKETVKKWDIY